MVSEFCTIWSAKAELQTMKPQAPLKERTVPCISSASELSSEADIIAPAVAQNSLKQVTGPKQAHSNAPVREALKKHLKSLKDPRRLREPF